MGAAERDRSRRALVRAHTACNIDLAVSMHSNLECNDCIGEMCCPQAEAFEANPVEATYLALFDFMFQPSMCRDECTFDFCDFFYVIPFEPGCADCVDTHCCTQFAACRLDGACISCTETGLFTPSPCCESPEYVAYDACMYDHCESECYADFIDHLRCNVGGGGSGGAGGSGGSGGT